MNYKTVFNPGIETNAGNFEQEFATHAEAEAALDAVANYTLMLHEHGLMPDFSNYGMVMRKDDEGEWIEIDGDDEELM